MKQVEISAKKIDDAIAEGLRQLDVTIAEVNVEILDQGGFFRKAKVRLTVESDEELIAEVLSDKPEKTEKSEKPEKADKPTKPEKEKKAKPEKPEKPDKSKAQQDSKAAPATKREKKPPVDTRPEASPIARPLRVVDDSQVEIARAYLEKLLGLMKINAAVEIDTSHGSIDVDLVTEDTAVIGHRGEVLDAIQILTKRAVEEGEDKFVHVNVDSHNYRVKREESLVALAERMAAKCVRTGKKVMLEPMNNTHRKIIHAALSDNDEVITKSEGREPTRKVVIIPKRH